MGEMPPRHGGRAQARHHKEDALLQDSKSAMLLQKNYPYPAGKGSQHTHARYYFAARKAKSKELRAARCPAGKLVAGYSNEPLHGALLATHRSTLLGVREEGFKLCEKMRAEALKQRGLLVDGEGLHGAQLAGVRWDARALAGLVAGTR